MKRFKKSILDLGLGMVDDPTEKARKRLFVLTLLLTGISATILGIFPFQYRESLPGIIWLSWGVWQWLVLAALRRSQRLPNWLISFHLTLALMVAFALSYLLGSFVQLGYAFYALTVPILAMALLPRQTGWLAWLCAALIIAGLSLEPSLSFSKQLPSWLTLLWSGVNTLLAGLAVFFVLDFNNAQRERVQRKLKEEQDKTERLLVSIFPEKVAAQLKHSLIDESTVPIVAEHFKNASVLFADMVNFTPMSTRMSAAELVNMLNSVFSHFDRLAQKRGLEKIKTVGDCYIVAAGVPQPRADHAQALAELALEIQSFVKLHSFTNQKVSFRIGINSGPLVAGVIGQKKLSYDLWGDTVNIASRMASHGIGGGIQIAPCTYELLKDDFICLPRGKIFVKGKGDMEIWLLTGKRNAPSP